MKVVIFVLAIFGGLEAARKAKCKNPKVYSGIVKGILVKCLSTILQSPRLMIVMLQGLEGDVYVDSCHEFTCTGPPSGSKGLWVERPAL